MSRLFDDEPRRRRKAAPDPLPAAAPPTVASEVTTLGRFDDRVACLDQTCQATTHDIVAEDRSRWRLECCLCGTGQWVPAVPGVLAPQSARFVFASGRFGGLSIDEAAMQPRGMDYITWAAQEHPRQAVRKACESWLAQSGAGL